MNVENVMHPLWFKCPCPIKLYIPSVSHHPTVGIVQAPDVFTYYLG